MGARQDTSYFWLKRLHSLMGAIPLAAFLLIHFTLNSFAIADRAAFNKVIAALHSFPLTLFFEIFLIAIPLLLHIMMGLVIVYRSSGNVVSYSYYRNWMYFLQRVSGVIGLAFVIFHVWSMRIAPAIGGRHATYSYMQSYFAPMWVKIFYTVGIIAIVFHVANGLASALATWGITQTKRSQFAATIASWVVMIVFWLWGMRILFEFV